MHEHRGHGRFFELFNNARGVSLRSRRPDSPRLCMSAPRSCWSGFAIGDWSLLALGIAGPVNADGSGPSPESRWVNRAYQRALLLRSVAGISTCLTNSIEFFEEATKEIDEGRAVYVA